MNSNFESTNRTQILYLFLILDCGTIKSECERTIDDFLNSYCENITLAVIANSPSLPTLNATAAVSPTHSQPNTQNLKITQFTLTTTVGSFCGATSSGDHWIGVHLLDHEERTKSTTKQVN